MEPAPPGGGANTAGASSDSVRTGASRRQLKVDAGKSTHPAPIGRQYIKHSAALDAQVQDLALMSLIPAPLRYRWGKPRVSSIKHIEHCSVCQGTRPALPPTPALQLDHTALARSLPFCHARCSVARLIPASHGIQQRTHRGCCRQQVTGCFAGRL